MDTKGKLKTLLIIDDETEILNSLIKGLKTKFTIVTASDGDKGLELISIHQPDCVLLDIRMPGKSGIDVIKEIQLTYPQIPVVIMTGHGDEQTAIEALRHGAKSYLKKPLDLYEIIEAVNGTEHSHPAINSDLKITEILLVTDDMTLPSDMTKTNTCVNYNLGTSATENIALASIKAKNIDMLIVDLDVPGMDGAALIKKAKELQPDILVIMLTAKSEQEEAINAIEIGVFDYLKKPIDIHHLNASIARGLHKISETKELRQTNINLCAEVDEQKEYVESIMHSMTNMLFVTDIDGRITTGNDASMQMLGYSASELAQESFSRVLKGENLPDFIQEIVKSGHIKNQKKSFTSKTGENIPVLLSASILKKGNDKLKSIIFIAQDLSEKKAPNKQFEKSSLYDSLTSLPNHTQYENTLKKELGLANNRNERLAILVIGIDDYKQINGTQGKTVADKLLKQAAERIQLSLSSNYFISRLEDDKFGVILTSTKDDDEITNTATQLMAAVDTSNELFCSVVQVTASIGIAVFPDACDEPLALTKYAKIALSYASAAGRNQCLYFTPEIKQKYQKRIDAEKELRQALSKEQMYLMYQSIYDLPENKIVGFDVMLKWKHPDLGDIPSNEIFSIAEDSGLIMSIGEWMLRAAFDEYVKWQSYTDEKIHLGIKLSSHQLEQEQTLAVINDIFDQHNISPELIHFKVPESSMINNPSTSKDLLAKLLSKKCGVVVAVDNFKIGQSSLNYLNKLPVNRLKIDKNFIDEINNEEGRAIVRTIITLAKSSNLSIMAEGVETEDQLQFLLQNGCDFVQGCYLGKPVGRVTKK